MSILIVSPDADAARSLHSALGRRGERSRWLESAEAALGDTPLVLVVDRAAPRFRQLIDDVARRTPWARIYEMDAADARAEPDPGVLTKPFDAGELATLLVREHELAELDRRRAALEAEAGELALLVEASFEAIIGLGKDGSIRSWNRGAASIYGYAAAEMLGRPLDVLEVSAGAATARFIEAPEAPVEAVRRRKDGEEVLVLLSLSPVTNGTRFAFAETSLDITVRRKLERELEHEKRLSAIGRIAAGMAHEINNPLVVVRAANTYVAEIARDTGDELLIETVEDVRLAVDRISSFVNHVCGFARRDRPNLSDSSVRETMRMALRLAKPRAAEQRVDVTLEAGIDVRLAHDAARISQALLNLVANGIDAASEGQRHVVIRLLLDGSSARIQVDDDGPGIAESVRDRAFDPFTTTKPPGRGTGLGLAIARQIIDEHGGAVVLSPRPSARGTRAEIILPLVTKAPSMRPRRSSRPPPTID